MKNSSVTVQNQRAKMKNMSGLVTTWSSFLKAVKKR